MVLFIFRFGEVIQVDLPETSRVPRPRPRRGPSLGPSCTSRCGSPLTPPAWPPSPTPWRTAPCSSSSSPSSEQVRFSPFNKLCYLTHSVVRVPDNCRSGNVLLLHTDVLKCSMISRLCRYFAKYAAVAEYREKYEQITRFKKKFKNYVNVKLLSAPNFPNKFLFSRKFEQFKENLNNIFTSSIYSFAQLI